MRLRLLPFVALTSVACSTAGQVQPISTEYADKNLLSEDIKADALKAASVALQRFVRRTSDLKCFSVDIYQEEAGWRVAFIANQPGGDTVHIGVAPCGESISYVVSADFVVTREILSR